MEGQSVQVPGSPRSADFAGPLVRRQPRMSSWVGEIHLGPRVVQPQSFLGRGQLVSLEETLEEQVTPLPQVRQATVGHPHPRTLAALAVRPHRHFDSAAVQGHRRTRRLGRHPPRGLPTLLTSLTPGCPTRPGYPDRTRSSSRRCYGSSDIDP